MQFKGNLESLDVKIATHASTLCRLRLGRQLCGWLRCVRYEHQTSLSLSPIWQFALGTISTSKVLRLQPAPTNSTRTYFRPTTRLRATQIPRTTAPGASRSPNSETLIRSKLLDCPVMSRARHRFRVHPVIIIVAPGRGGSRPFWDCQIDLSNGEHDWMGFHLHLSPPAACCQRVAAWLTCSSFH